MKKSLIFAAFLIAVTNGVALGDIPSVDYVGAMLAQLQAEVAEKAADDDVVHKTGDETIAGDKTFTGTVVVPAPENTANDNSVSTTAWTNGRINDMRGTIPVGSATATEFTKIWIEE